MISVLPQVMVDMGLADAFNVALHVKALRDVEVATVLKALNAFAPDQACSPVLKPLSTSRGRHWQLRRYG